MVTPWYVTMYSIPTATDSDSVTITRTHGGQDCATSTSKMESTGYYLFLKISGQYPSHNLKSNLSFLPKNFLNFKIKELLIGETK